MRVYSFCESGFGFKPLEVEVALLPGIPQFIISGLPDQAIKESLIRIQSALRAQGFQLPTRQKVYINLKPSYEKKKSRGVELAMACAYLWATEQVPTPKRNDEDVYVYGELGLNGEVNYIEDIDWVSGDPTLALVSGLPREGSCQNIYGMKELKDLACLALAKSTLGAELPSRPPLEFMDWPAPAAEALAILALGEHHAFLAGPAGTGKTTFAKSLHVLMKDLTQSEWRDIRLWHRKQHPDWRPFRHPHHTATTPAIVGGGNPPEPGEVTKSAHGLLLLDEFLEFPNYVRESLREPMESGEITISRKGNSEKFPANFQLLAATNLCPCGDYVPTESVNCKISLHRCRAYIDKMSGPLLDRFDLLILTNTWKRKKFISLEKIFQQVEAGRNNLEKWNRKAASKLSENEIIATLADREFLQLSPTTSSRRRQRALLRVARTLADLEGSEKIEIRHLDRATQWAITPFDEMKHKWG